MGSDWNPNQALSVDLLLALLEFVEGQIREAEVPVELNRWVVAHTYIVVEYVLSMRGPEGFLLDLDSTNRYWAGLKQDSEVIYICLRGQVKGEHGERCHVLPCVPLTSSGINVRESVERLLKLKRLQGHEDGPAISSVKGRVFSTHSVNDCFVDGLVDLFESRRELFPPRASSLDEVRKIYHVYRSLRRSSDSRALDMQVPGEDIDVVNRWEGVEAAKGKRPNRTMKQHYADILMMEKPFKRYTWAM